MSDKPIESSDVFSKICKDYLDRIAAIDVASKTGILGIDKSGDEWIIPLFNRPFRLSNSGIYDPNGHIPPHAIRVVLCKYILLCPDTITGDSEWISYRNFKNAAPFAEAFSTNAEKSIALKFSGKLNELKQASKGLEGVPPETGFSYDHQAVFQALPRIPLLLLFNDADEDFPAQASVLFQRCSSNDLDMECLAIIGWFLADELIRMCEASYTTTLM